MPDIEESLSKITGIVTNNSVILDIGCSSGMLGRYLSRKKGCVIDGIDIDESALKNCHPIYRKVIIKNLETDDVMNELIAESYDFIVVADVIEHLNQPEKLLRQLRLLIKPHGTIIFSVPNITHIAASLELLSGRFNYAPNGLLDNTHLRFYSYQNLVEKLANSGLYLWALETVHRDLTETEFGDAQVNLFPRQWLDALIASRPDSLVYQWIVSTRIYPSLEIVNDLARQKRRSISPIFTTALYWERDADSGFNEINKLPGYKKEIGNNEVEVEFHFPISETEKIHRIRIDPASEVKSIWLKSAKIIDSQNVVLWRWSGQESLNDLVNAHWVDVTPVQGKIFSSANNDPQWYPQIPCEILQEINAGTKFVMQLSDHSATIDLQLEDGLHKQKSEAKIELHKIDEENRALVNVIDERDNFIAEQNQQVASLQQLIAQRDAHIHSILTSSSWIVTKPFRYLRRKFGFGIFRSLSRLALRVVRFVWDNFPLPRHLKGKLKSALLGQFPSMFRFYRSRVGSHASDENLRSYLSTTSGTSGYQADDEAGVYVPLLQSQPLTNKPVKIICFYLPQFHAIAENDAWWGKGFTEWTNVQPAQPQFVNHYQPHIPGELGYYNLLDKATQHRQIELAKLYGIEGFCFYFYWFGGKRLLETPIANYLNDSTLDLPFCLCWANENWSRRWDGLDHEMLIAQQHSPEDDLAFIQHVAQYMRDTRYIRIDGKPLLLVYRPGLLPDPKETVARWRTWCRENDIGEIYLAYTQSFESIDPTVYDFDAAIEFPPNNSALPNITSRVKPLRPEFEGNVYDYRDFIKRSENYQKSPYKLFRSVCPSWDNTARRKNKGSILLNSSPSLFQKWLSNAILDTEKTQSVQDERLIFVNAWNEWAEGAHLEPDQRYGYAYLEATRMAQSKFNVQQSKKNIDRNLPIAIVIHAFYEEVFDEILVYLKKLRSIQYVLYVTAPAGNMDGLQKKLLQSGQQFILLQVENRGRDVLPFLKIMPHVVQANHEIVIKVHTKKSLHREDGDVWRQDLFQELISEEAVTNVLNYFEANQNVGILGPRNHIVPMSYYWGANARTVYSLAKRLGVDLNIVDRLSFIAGTMFCAKVSALIPLLNLSINEDDFEEESGQIDGTLAHAVERCISISVFAAGFDVPKAEVVDYQFVT